MLDNIIQYAIIAIVMLVILLAILKATRKGAQLDFNNVAAFEITVDQNNEEMIRMIDPDSENFKTLAVYELDQVMSELYPQYNEKLEELLDLEEE